MRSALMVPSALRAVRKIASPGPSIYQHLPFVGRFSVDVEPGKSFQLESRGDVVENDLFWAGFGKSWEADSLKRWVQLAKSSKVILDIGANTGVFALSAQTINPGATVLAMEASARTANRLRQNVRMNDYPIIVEEAAASDADEVLTFYDFPGEHQYSASLQPSMGGSIESKVQAYRLDSVLDRHGLGKIDLMKMDVERHEPAALRGMRGRLESDRPTIFIEVLDDECRRGIEEALSGFDYSWEKLDDDEGRNFLLTSASR
ncbi:FkbM family methyltransferase [Sphingomonas sp. LY29]|uniref:FkbM family methyltransferase n=1 Tax=Sphingomonas sp. LY29 TaxID=3095341 RepID=UPI002D773479|nr:FkbM family methyltransferase [Sphingomonas sp. LY29]WRP26233.1 FkbM family methyltransferase [Sphingomonas sp. LY29]